MCEDRIEKTVPQVTDCHHSASLVIPIHHPQDGFFYLILTLMIDSYIMKLSRNEGSLLINSALAFIGDFHAYIMYAIHKNFRY